MPRRLSAGRKLLALGAFVAVGLLPSYVDWQQSPDKRPAMVTSYAIAAAAFWAGVLR